MIKNDLFKSPPLAEREFQLAKRFDSGARGLRNSYLAREHYRRAAQMGNVAAQLRLGQIYLTGEGLKKPQYAEAREFFSLAAKKGDPEGLFQLGLLLYRGLGFPDIGREKRKLPLKRPVIVGGLYGKAGPGITRLGRSLIKDAARKGHVGAQSQIGWILYHEGKPKAATKWMRRAAENGNSNSQHGLAICLLEGDGMKPDLTAGMRWLRLAAESGNHEAQYYLGRMLASGEGGVPMDAKEAVNWIKKATESNWTYTAVNAAHNVWTMYYYGKGIPQDYVEARKWIEKTLKFADEEDALAAIVEIYEKGLGVKRNLNKARYWRKRLQAF